MPPLPFSSTTTVGRFADSSAPTASPDAERDVWWRRLDRWPVPFCVLLLRAYRAVFGPWVAGACRFEPSCSHYAEQAVRRHGTLRGIGLTVVRLVRCQPFHPGGYDPVPPAASDGRGPATEKNS